MKILFINRILINLFINIIFLNCEINKDIVIVVLLLILFEKVKLVF